MPNLKNTRNSIVALKTILIQKQFQIAASHVSANAIIHFGHACLSKVSRLAVHYVFSNFKLDVDKIRQEFQNTISNADEEIVVFYATGLVYHLGLYPSVSSNIHSTSLDHFIFFCFSSSTDDIKSALSSFTNVSYAQLALDSKPDNLCWKMPKNNLSEAICVWIGDDNQSLFNLSLTVNGEKTLT